VAGHDPARLSIVRIDGLNRVTTPNVQNRTLSFIAQTYCQWERDRNSFLQLDLLGFGLSLSAMHKRSFTRDYVSVSW
jgi:hypothetical protein